MASSDPVQKVTFNKEPPESEELHCEEAACVKNKVFPSKPQFFFPPACSERFYQVAPSAAQDSTTLVFIHTSHFLHLKRAKTPLLLKDANLPWRRKTVQIDYLMGTLAVF